MPDASEAKPKRRSKLLAVAPEAVEPRKPKILIYGPPGVGKTWVSIEWPEVYYFDTEGGADLAHYRDKLKKAGGMYFGPEQGSLDFDSVIGQVEALATETHPYRTMVFDSATKLYDQAIADEGMRLGDKDVFGASKKAPIRQMARLLSAVNRSDMNAIFICHQKDMWGKDEKGNREVVGVTFTCWERMEYDLHLVMRISKIGVGDNAKRFAHVGKSRLPAFPEGDRFDWSYEAFAERYGRDVIEKAVVPLVLTSEEQLKELNDLLERVKLPDGTVQKWLTKADVETFAEMESAMAQKCIDFLKERAKV